jgi:cytochrome P450
VVTNLWALHHDEDFWGDPFTFRPSRFLDVSGDVVPASDDMRRHLMAFGAGPRVCVGELLALGRLFLLVASMAQVFEVLPGKVASSCDPMTFAGGFVLAPRDYEITLKQRNEQLYAKRKF